MSPHRHPLLTIRNLTSRKGNRMFNHERDYSEENSFPRTAQRSTREKNSDQRKVEENLDHPPVIPGISPHLLCERTRFGVRSRSGVLCDHRGDLSLANPCRRSRATRVLSEHPCLTALYSGERTRPRVPISAPSPKSPAQCVTAANGGGSLPAIGEGANRCTRGRVRSPEYPHESATLATMCFSLTRKSRQRAHRV